MQSMEQSEWHQLIIKVKLDMTRLPASRSSSIGPEGRFLFLHPKVKVKE